MNQPDKVKQFLQDLLQKNILYNNSDEDNKIIQKQGLSNWITSKLLSAKFRKSKLVEITKNNILQKVTSSVDNNKPIYLIICFGGYKHYWNKSHPEVDWAELFNLAFMIDYVSPILANHKPGAILEYEAEDYILPKMNNYPENAIFPYSESFNKLTKYFDKVLPSNFQIRFLRAATQYDTTKLFQKLEGLLPQKVEELKSKTDENSKKMIKKAASNIMWKGKDDLSQLTEKEQYNFAIKSRCMNELFLQIDYEFREQYFVGNDHISIVLSWGRSQDNVDQWLTLGSTYSSTVDFWIGRGILEDRGDKLIPRIVSHEQYVQIKDKLITVPLTIIPLKNFSQIDVYPGTLNFSL